MDNDVAGVAYSPDAMYAYLEREVGDVVSSETLRAFCTGSADTLAWLEQHGVPFDATPCPCQPSDPNNEFYRYCAAKACGDRRGPQRRRRGGGTGPDGQARREDTGAARRPDGTAVGGLSAAGGAAVGICSRSYVGGLSLADCVISGRRAGEHRTTAGISTRRR